MKKATKQTVEALVNAARLQEHTFACAKCSDYEDGYRSADSKRRWRCLRGQMLERRVALDKNGPCGDRYYDSCNGYHLVCQEAKGHKGVHNCGGATWEDRDSHRPIDYDLLPHTR